MAIGGILLEFMGQFETSHLWHHDIGDYEIDGCLMDDVKGFFSVLGYQNVILVLQYVLHQHEQLGVVFYD